MEPLRQQTARQRAKRGTSCITCRQMKLRCDSGDRYPAACSRCVRVGRACSLDPGLKRSSKVDRLVQLQKEINELREGLKLQGSSSSRDPSPPSIATGSSDAGAPELDDIAETTELQTQTLERVQITPPEFMELVGIFYLHYHPQLPFLPKSSLLVRTCTQCPLLYWAIVSVTCRTSEKHRSLYTKLAWPIRRLALDSTVQDITSLSQIQGLMLLCLWPLPFASLIDDPAWTFCGIATHKALQMGLHRPGHIEDFLNGAVHNDEFHQSRRHTWLALFIVNHYLSIRNGIPATIRPCHTIFKALSDEGTSTPPVLKTILEIMVKDHVMSNILGHSEKSSDGLHPDPLPLIEAYERDLDILQARLERTWSPIIEMTFLGVKLRLYSFAMSAPTQAPNDLSSSRYQLTPGSLYEAANYITKLYATTMRILHLATQGFPDPNADPRGDDEAHRYWNGMDFQALSSAVMVLLHITRRRQHTFDLTESHTVILRAWTLLKSCSVIRGDIYSRMCDILEYISSVDWPTEAMTTRQPQIPDLLVHSRMGSNIVFDLVKWVQRRFLIGVRYPRQLIEEQLEGLSVEEGVPGVGEFESEDLEGFFWPEWDGDMFDHTHVDSTHVDHKHVDSRHVDHTHVDSRHVSE